MYILNKTRFENKSKFEAKSCTCRDRPRASFSFGDEQQRSYGFALNGGFVHARSRAWMEKRGGSFVLLKGEASFRTLLRH